MKSENDTLKIEAGALASAIPIAGPFLKALIDIFWPESNYWKKLLEEVKKMIDQAIFNEHFKDVKELLEGYASTLKVVVDLGREDQHSQLLALDTDINDNKYLFYPDSGTDTDQNAEDFIKMLPTFTSMAVLHLSVNARLIEISMKLGKDNSDIEGHRKTCATLANDYIQFAQRAVDTAIQWRLSKITADGASIGGVQIPATTFTDHFTGETMQMGGGPLNIENLTNYTWKIRKDIGAYWTNSVLRVLEPWSLMVPGGVEIALPVDRLYADEYLIPGESITSRTPGAYTLRYARDGNLVIKENTQTIGEIIHQQPAKEVFWSTGISDPGGSWRAIMQGDGDLVVYSEESDPAWATNTEAQNCVLIMQSDGSLVIQNDKGVVLWSSSPSTG